MLLIISALLLLISNAIQGGVVRDDSSEDGDDAYTDKLAEFFGQRCMKNHAQLIETLVEIKGMHRCIHKLLPKRTDEDYEEFGRKCHQMVTKVAFCMEKLVTALVPCLEPEESYAPEFIVKSSTNSIHYFCTHINNLTVDRLLDTTIGKCFNRFHTNIELSPQYDCDQSFRIALNSKDSPITKAELCKDLNTAYSCYEDHFKRECPDAPKAWKFQAGLLNGTRSPCSS